MAPPPDPLNRKPWPMKWIVLAIIACVIPYTWLTLAYRKENPAHQPYQDNKDRAQVLRLLENDFYRFDLSMELLSSPFYPPTGLAETEQLAGGLPPLLRDVLIDPPTLPSRVPVAMALAVGSAGDPYEIYFGGARPGPGERPASATLYRRDSELVILVGYDIPPRELKSRNLNATARITIPAGTLDSGDFQVTLLGERESRRWRLRLE